MEATSSYFFGRTIIESSVSEITRENVLAQLKKAKVTHDTNSRQIDYLYKYYKGNQPILYRTKTVRPEINNKIVENHAFEIVDFKKGYVFGEPIQYVRRGEADGISEKITTLNEYMFAEDKHSGDRDLAEWFYICGTAYRMILPDAEKAKIDEAPFEIDCLDPRYAFVVYSNSFGRRPLMGVKYIVNEDKSTLYSVYTPTEYFEILDNKILEVSGPHSLGDIPIIEYPANPNRIGAFEVVLGLLDAMNSTVSNRLDAIDQFVQSFMKFVNCDIDETTFTALKQLGALKIRSDNTQPADVDIVSSELDQGQTQISKDDLYQMVLIICGMPDRNGGNKSTGDTGQAVILRDGWGAAEAKAKDCELSFKKSEKRFLKIALRIIEVYKTLGLKLSQIEIKFTRNKTDNLLTKAQGLQNMLEAGIHPQIAISNVGLFSDPEQVYLDSREYLEKWKNKPVLDKTDPNKPKETTSNQKPNPSE